MFKNIFLKNKKIYDQFLKIRDYIKTTFKNIEKKIPNWYTREKDHPAVLRFGLAIILCLLALSLKMLLDPVLADLPFILFYSAILMSSWYGGFWPGIVATILSASLSYFTFILPVSKDPFWSNMLAEALFILEGTLIAGISNSMHKAFQTYEEKDRYLRYYASIAQNISDAVISTDMNDVIQSWNKGAEHLYGHTEKDVVGYSINEIIPTTYLLQQKKEINDSIFYEGSWKGEVIHKRKNGSRVYVLTSTSLIRDEDDKPLGLVLVNRDISDRKKLEQGKDDFIALASHELKTPLTSTKLYVDVLKQRFEDSEDKKSLSYISKINLQIQKLLELVSHLLDVSKVQAGKLQYNLEEVSFDRFVIEVVRDIRQITPSHKFMIDGSTDKVVCIDKDRMRQVLVNILNNAVKYSSQADKVIVSLHKDGAQVRLGIQDFGIGIPKEKQDKIFERFYQVTDSKGYTYSGMGLGLYISHEIIEKHHGKLWAESVEGKGSTFFIKLPTVKR